MKIDLNENDWRVGPTGAMRDIRAVVPGCIHKDLLRAEENKSNEKKIFGWVADGESIQQITEKAGYF